jgi:hypothetical protein
LIKQQTNSLQVSTEQLKNAQLIEKSKFRRKKKISWSPKLAKAVTD